MANLSFSHKLLVGFIGSLGVGLVGVIALTIWVFASHSNTPSRPDPITINPTAAIGSSGSSVAIKDITSKLARELGFDVMPAVTMPLDNPLTDAKIELGKILFFDSRLSGNGLLSCATCHQPTLGWGDALDINFGYPESLHWRNSQTIINSAYWPLLFWDGSTKSLESQAKAAWTGATGQNIDSMLLEERLAQAPEYVAMFKDVFGTEIPLFDDALRAVAAFEATINTVNAPFDAWIAGDESAISASAKRGMELFVGEAGCSACHGGPLFSDFSYHNLGVPANEKFVVDPQRQLAFRYQNRKKGVPEHDYREATNDLGLYYVTKLEDDRGKFRTPFLRDLVQTGPYMHNGTISTLEGVVQFYNAGGGSHDNKDSLLSPLGLTSDQVADLVEFLLTLSGDPIIVEPPAMPEYEVAG